MKPVRYSINTIEDLPLKLGFLDITMRMLSVDEPDFAGF